MSTGIQISSGSSGISVGTTAVTSGTNGRVFFQAGGVVQQDANFTFDNTLKRLTLRAVNTGAGDIPFAIRNSADTQDVLRIQGDNRLHLTVATGATYENSITFEKLGGFGSSSIIPYFESGSSYGLGFGVRSGGNTGTNVASLRLDNSSNVSIGATSGAIGARLDVRSQGALSTDIAFRVRNSANSANIFSVQGDGNVLFNNTTHGLLFNSQTLGYNQLELYSYGLASTIINPVVSRFAFTGITTTKGVVIGNSSTTPAALLDVYDFAGPGPGTTVARFGSQFNSTGADNLNILFSSRYSGFTAGSAHLARLNIGQTGSGASTNARSYFKFELIRNNTLAERASITSQSNLLLQTPTEDTNDIGVIYIPNGTAPTGSITDGYKQYSADITAGNAAPHFRTENGDIIKLYRETTAVGAATLVSGSGTTLTDTDTFDGYTLEQVVKALRNLGILA